MNFWENLEKKLKDIRANKFPEHPTDKQYANDYTYKEDGRGKFPIRTEAPDKVLEKDISDAERLEHTVSPKDQEKVNHRIEEIKKEKHLD